MKRFYKLVSTAKIPGGYEVQLDGKPIKTPARNVLLAEAQEIADLIMQEWAGQGDEIDHETMPLTQILSTKIDRVSRERDAMVQGLMRYLDTDLLCYRTPHPPELLSAQEKAWDPWLSWFEKRFGAALLVTQDLSVPPLDPSLKEAVLAHIDALDADHFTLFQLVTPLCGSLVLGLAFIEGAIDPESIFNAARVEEQHKAEIYNEEFYGADPVEEKKDLAVQRDLKAAAEYLAAL